MARHRDYKPTDCQYLIRQSKTTLLPDVELHLENNIGSN